MWAVIAFSQLLMITCSHHWWFLFWVDEGMSSRYQTCDPYSNTVPLPHHRIFSIETQATLTQRVIAIGVGFSKSFEHNFQHALGCWVNKSWDWLFISFQNTLLKCISSDHVTVTVTVTRKTHSFSFLMCYSVLQHHKIVQRKQLHSGITRGLSACTIFLNNIFYFYVLCIMLSNQRNNEIEFNVFVDYFNWWKPLL